VAFSVSQDATERLKEMNGRGSCVGILVCGLVCGLVLVLAGVALNASSARGEVLDTQATARAELLAVSTPVSDVAIVAVQGMDTLAEVASEGFNSNVKIAASGDFAQAVTSQAWCLSMWAFPASLLAFGFLLWVLKGKGGNHEGK